MNKSKINEVMDETIAGLLNAGKLVKIPKNIICTKIYDELDIMLERMKAKAWMRKNLAPEA